MKRSIKAACPLLCAVITMSITASCGKNEKKSEPAHKLVNHMTENELSKAEKADTLLSGNGHITWTEAEAITEGGTFWVYNEDEIKAIQNSITEYHFYDDELAQSFVAHVTTPPDYDPEKEYPIFLMNDAVWWFGEVPLMYNEMANGANQYIIVTLGMDYDMNSWNDNNRADIYMRSKDKSLDFITDNLVPYLAGEYKINTDDSVLLGHSCGGVFTHYAAFSYDNYDNQPFGKYIIASPAFWAIPVLDPDSEWETYKNEYGFFEKNKSFSKSVFLTAGTLEDADFASYYGDGDNTTQGIEHLKERMKNNGCNDVTLEMFPGHHMDYIHEMLKRYLHE